MSVKTYLLGLVQCHSDFFTRNIFLTLSITNASLLDGGEIVYMTPLQKR